MLLSAIGVYGLPQYLVTQRRHEMAVRVALGASRQDVLVLVVCQGLTLAVIGIAISICVALGLTRTLGTLLYDVAPTDLLSFAIATVILLGVAAFACRLPARETTRINPMIALREA